MPERWRRDRFRCLQLLHLGCRPLSNKFKPPRQGASMLPNFILVCDGRTICDARKPPRKRSLDAAPLSGGRWISFIRRTPNERSTRKLSTEKMRAATTLMAARLNTHTMPLNNNGHQHVFFTMTEWVSHPGAFRPTSRNYCGGVVVVVVVCFSFFTFL